MNRLTIRNSDGSVSQPTNLDWSAALEKLAAYEDTGLTPEHIMALLNPPPCIYYDISAVELVAAYSELSKGNTSAILHLGSKQKIWFDGIWRSTKDIQNLPKVGVPVWIARRKRIGEPLVSEAGTLMPDGRWKAMGHKFSPENVLFWMSMPEPPKEGCI